MGGRPGGWRWAGGVGEAVFGVDSPDCGIPGQQGGNFQGPLVLTKEREGCLVVREVCLPEGFG